MDKPLDRREESTSEPAMDDLAQETVQELQSIPTPETAAEIISSADFATVPTSPFRGDVETLRRRGLRRNLSQLLGFTLAAFILTAWILVRLDSSTLRAFLIGPQEVVRAQLEALDEGQIRPAYNMFSPRYRQQVSFDVWRELIATHWRMFHSEVLQTGEPARTGKGVTLEMVVRGADEKSYRAQFTLIRMNGRWWIDDLHWAEEPDQRDVTRT